MDEKTKGKKNGKKHDGHGDGHGMQSQVGMRLELWEKAMTKYPDIVEKHGQLSGELFQAMLGLEVLDSKLVSTMKQNKNHVANP